MLSAQEMVAQVQRFCEEYCTRLPAYSYVPCTTDEQRLKVMQSRCSNEIRAAERAPPARGHTLPTALAAPPARRGSRSEAPGARPRAARRRPFSVRLRTPSIRTVAILPATPR